MTKSPASLGRERFESGGRNKGRRGYYHDFEETLTFLYVRVQVTIVNQDGSDNF